MEDQTSRTKFQDTGMGVAKELVWKVLGVTER